MYQSTDDAWESMKEWRSERKESRKKRRDEKRIDWIRAKTRSEVIEIFGQKNEQQI